MKNYQANILNPGNFFLQLFMGSSLDVTINGDEDRKHQFRQEYEDFKIFQTYLNIPLVLMILFINFYFGKTSRLLDQFYQVFITYFYITLAFRENILKVNGSNILSWWIIHHYLSILVSIMMLTWPKTEHYLAFRSGFYLYSLYTALLQIMQHKYQKKRLYIAKTLGKADPFDIANADSTPMQVERSFFVLLPFIFFGHGIQFYFANLLLRLFWRQESRMEWQVLGVGLTFLILGTFNVITMIEVIYNKFKNKKRQSVAMIESINKNK